MDPDVVLVHEGDGNIENVAVKYKSENSDRYLRAVQGCARGSEVANRSCIDDCRQCNCGSPLQENASIILWGESRWQTDRMSLTSRILRQNDSGSTGIPSTVSSYSRISKGSRLADLSAPAKGSYSPVSSSLTVLGRRET